VAIEGTTGGGVVVAVVPTTGAVDAAGGLVAAAVVDDVVVATDVRTAWTRRAVVAGVARCRGGAVVPKELAG
jgi:hypothetical protein